MKSFSGGKFIAITIFAFFAVAAALQGALQGAAVGWVGVSVPRGVKRWPQPMRLEFITASVVFSLALFIVSACSFHLKGAYGTIGC